MVDSRLVRMVNFMEAIWDLYVKRKGKKVPKEVFEERLEICRGCEHHTGKRCTLCGCCTSGPPTLFNKAAYPNEECPIGLWGTHNEPDSSEDS